MDIDRPDNDEPAIGHVNSEPSSQKIPYLNLGRPLSEDQRSNSLDEQQTAEKKERAREKRRNKRKRKRQEALNAVLATPSGDNRPKDSPGSSV